MSEKLSRPKVWARLTPLEREAFIRGLTQEERDAFLTDFNNYAHDGQLPFDDDWHVWLIMAGRGFGKTRAGAEWVRFIAETLPDARIALVAASLGEARAVMVEGESGVLACCPLGSAPAFEPSLRRVTWPNGAQATLYSAANPIRCAARSTAMPTGQAQKEFFVNEAFTRIDTLLHPVVEEEAGAPPLSPEPGDCWLIADPASGAWTDRETELASWDGTQWTYCAPSEGMLIFDRSTGTRLVFRDGWVRLDRPAGPDGGAVVDSEARATITALVDILATLGLFPPN